MATTTLEAQSRRRLYPILPGGPLDLSTHGHRQLLGVLGVALPFLCWTIGLLWPQSAVLPGSIPDALPPGTYGSISAYYYSSASWIFCGTLVAMALFLFTYEGYGDRFRAWDYRTSNFAGAMALGVAAFPTRPDPHFPTPGWWQPYMGGLHLAAAALLLLSFAVFCFFLFPTKDKRVQPEQRDALNIERLTPGQRLQHYWVYYTCGLGIIGSLAWALVQMLRGGSVFLPETLALVFFGISWLRKGHAHWSLRALLNPELREEVSTR